MALPDCMQGKVRIPLIGSPLFIISQPDLVIAQCLNGVVGAFPSLNARTLGALDEWLDRISGEIERARTHDPEARIAPYAVNLIVHKTNNRLDQDLELVVKYKVPIVITSLGAREDVFQAVNSYGGVVLHDVIDRGFAEKALNKGANGLIAVATGAGGHAGVLSPFALIQELREVHAGPLFLSGSLSTGASILAAQAMGADGGYMGSAFIACEEAVASDGYKDSIIDSSAADIVYTNLFTGVHGNYLGPSIRAAGLDPNDLPESDPSKMSFKSGGNSDAKVWRDIWGAGQGVGAVKQRKTAGAFIDQLHAEYVSARTRLDALSSAY